MNPNVCYLGPLLDYSGYGEANRHALAALHAAGANVVAKVVTYTSEGSDYGQIGALVNELKENRSKYNIKIIHTTPDQYARHMEPGKYHIGHFFWETDKVPADFAAGLELMDEIWTGSNANVDAIRNGGCTKPIKVFPQATETDREWPEPYEIRNFDGYLFYSIFEWIDRKNPEALIDAYYKEFQNGENVGLLIKTYFRNFNRENKKMIRTAIAKAKAKSGLSEFPPIFLYLDLMDRKHIMRLHKTGDCFVSAHHGEGWGIPQVEAALAGNLVITTGYGGVNEYFTDGGNALVIPYDMKPVKGMYHSTKWYDSEQNWADPKPEAIRSRLRFAYDMREQSQAIAKAGHEYVKSCFSLERVGALMVDRLKEIEREL